MRFRTGASPLATRVTQRNDDREILASSRRAQAIPATRWKIGFSIDVEVVELGGVLPENFLLVFSAHALEILGDFFPRMGPKSRAVRKVRRPEQVLYTYFLTMGDAETVIDKSRVKLAAKILAWLEGQPGWKRATVNARATRFKPLVQAAQKIG